MQNITPSDEQARAIKAIVQWYGERGRNEFYLAGYAGVGKSTIANLAIEEIRKKYRIKIVKTAAYTGKAASVLRKKGVEAQTIHSLIYTARINKETGQLWFVLSPESEASKADLIVLDECSMIDDRLANDLRSFGKKILVMGDPGQLPPIMGRGAFTRNEPDVFLQEIHRQCADSPIIELATLARKGLPMPVGYAKDAVKVLKLTKESQNLIYAETTQPICGLNKVRWTYTQRIRQVRGFNQQKPQPGEKVICCRNNNTNGLFNGGMGKLLHRTSARLQGHDVLSLDVKMDDLPAESSNLLTDPYQFQNHFTNGQVEKIPYTKPMLNEFDWGYIITAHKAQGSSWDHVTVVDDSGSFREHSAKWLYTSITRAETGLTLLLRI